jgi:N-methylhydantoinase A
MVQDGYVKRFEVGIDIGGTYIDIVIRDSETGEAKCLKVPTDLNQLAHQVMNGLAASAETFGIPFEAIKMIRHGTTVGTNSVLEKKLPLTGLITTRGFRDVLEIARLKRDRPYDLTWRRVRPLVARRRRKEVTERIAASGDVIKSLDVAELSREVRNLIVEGVETVAVAFLHSYRNAYHEKQVASFIREKYPDIYVSTSASLVPEIGEYERMSATVLNATLMPVMAQYLSEIEGNVVALHIDADLTIVQSNGGVMHVPYARSQPVRTLLSGPAAGVIGAVRIARLAGKKDFITLDMGGTSTDISLIRDGRPQFSLSTKVGGYPVPFPTIDIATVGAGGGSIGWVDEGGALRLGPQSAGAIPGPSCYGRGGREPTLTDAWLVTGFLDSGSDFTGVKLERDLAHSAIESLGKKVGLNSLETAEGLRVIAITNVAKAIKTVSSHRGFDPREFTLVAYGGAGPLIAADVAKDTKIRQVLIPPSPGTLCALGAIMAEESYEIKQTCLSPLTDDTLLDLRALVSRLAVELRHQAHLDSDAPGRVVAEGYLRYVGQLAKEPILLPHLEDWKVAEIRERLDQLYLRRYGLDYTNRPIEIESVRVVLVPERPDTHTRSSFKYVDTHTQVAKVDSRRMLSRGRWEECHLIHRATLGTQPISGPALILEYGSTAWVPSGATCRVVEGRSLLVEMG